jgi:Uma2 family endonuclease
MAAVPERVVPERRRFTVDDYHRMAEAGILAEDDRVELVGGEIVQMSPIGVRHAATVNRCNRVFSRAVGDRALVSVQNPVSLPPYDEPQPDIALLRPRDDDYARGKPGAADILLVVEVADTSVAYDRQTKLRRYAAAGVLEAWLLDLPGDALEIHRESGPRGYAFIRRCYRGEQASPQALPDLTVAVDDLLPVETEAPEPDGTDADR